MWNSDKSLKLSIIVCWIAGAVFAACFIGAPWLYRLYYREYSNLPGALESSVMIPCLICAYLGLAAGLWAIWMLLRMLGNIRDGKVFIQDNVRYLRKISWACFGAAAAALAYLIFSGSLGFIFVAAAGAFMGLILRVVKNVMNAAVEIRKENDLTI
ncbi:MAG: DUF2975 domain-containing protein [Oscillospiraceae bacterium]